MTRTRATSNLGPALLIGAVLALWAVVMDRDYHEQIAFERERQERRRCPPKVNGEPVRAIVDNRDGVVTCYYTLDVPELRHLR